MYKRIPRLFGLAALAGSACLLGCTVAAAQSPLGSPAELKGRFTTNYAEIARAALPQVNLDALTRLMAEVRAAAAAEKPLEITNVGELEKFFSLRPRAKADATELTQAGDASYLFNPVEHRIYLVQRYQGPRGVPRDEFAREVAAIRAAHLELADNLGIPRDQRFFTDFREILSQTDGHPTRQGGVQGPILSEGATTTILRAVGKVLVDGSSFRAASIDAKRLERLDVRWPPVVLADTVASAGLRAPQDVLTSVIKRIEANASGQPVNVRMAVVLRPIVGDKSVAFVPALRVGVQPQSVQVGDGFRTDAGEIFHVDLVRGSGEFADPDQRDSSQDR
jgi:hypothetical protein